MYNKESIINFLAYTVWPNNNVISLDELNDISYNKKRLEFAQYKKELIDIFEQEIQSYNIKDGTNVAVLLSGGLDSTLLLYFLKKFFPSSSFYTYTLAYHANDSHLQKAQDISKYFGTIHKEIIIDLDNDLFQIFDDIYQSWYDLEGEDSLIMNHILANYIKEDCQIVFSGFGLDYLFAGMDLFRNSYMEKIFAEKLIDKGFLLKTLGMNKFYLKYVLNKIENNPSNFFVKYGEYYGDVLLSDLQKIAKQYFEDSMNSINLDLTDLKKQILFIISTSLANRYNPYNMPYKKNGLYHYNPFGSKEVIKKVLALNIPDEFLLNPYTMEKKFIIRDIFRDLVWMNVITQLHSGTVLKYTSSIQANKDKILLLVKENREFLDKYYSDEFLTSLDKIIDDSIWYENSKVIIILLQLLFFKKYNNF